MTHSFRIQWHDSNSNYSGSLRGRHARGDDWESLDNFNLTANASYDFYMSVAEGVRYTTFVTIKVGAQVYGAKVPPIVHDDQGSGNDDAIHLGPLALSSADLELKACVLVSDDPKVHVTWGKGGAGYVATVQLIWTGSGGWTDANGRPIPDPISVETYSQVVIQVSDQSRNVSTVAIYEAQVMVGELREAGVGTAVATLVQPTGATDTTYTVNVFNVLPDAATLAV
ncbi:hypothetical protein DB30_07010 [Enhygromyxa salina]|uniref:Uncharacterized protein n=1 Tax=Enhygromyxa salina TaxID=215803 RepID=A0A0C2CSW6_9BACT|nr:hypothetical protein [Enhygromyxa salina]KIG14261.1 hypothetical protein DB30_07010 [Enhygromyxa salina]